MQVILARNHERFSTLVYIFFGGHGLVFWTSVEKRRQCARRNLQHTKSGVKHATVALYDSFSIFHYHYAVLMEGSNSDFHQPSILAWISQYAKYSCFCFVLSI
jgi:hypothetical protein